MRKYGKNYYMHITFPILKSCPCSHGKALTMGCWLQFSFVFIGKKQSEELEEGVNAKIPNGSSLPWQEQIHVRGRSRELGLLCVFSLSLPLSLEMLLLLLLEQGTNRFLRWDFMTKHFI